MFSLAAENLLSPMTLAFVLGVVAALVRSDLKLPAEVQAALSLYLLLAIGLKGGVALSEADPAAVVLPVLATLVLGVTQPAWSYVILRRLGRFSQVDAAALAAHYGSVSAVTFIAAIAFLTAAKVPAEGFMPALVALLEVPAILVAMWLGRRGAPAPRDAEAAGGLWHELLAGKVTLALVGGLVIGLLTGKGGMVQVEPFFVDPFKGVLALFLLELGRMAGSRLRDLRTAGVFLVAFGTLMPVLHAAVGIGLGYLAGLSAGGAYLFGVLAASASYIAAPAAVRMALPEANPGYYVTASLAITFPFNLTVGLPLYLMMAEALYA